MPDTPADPRGAERRAYRSEVRAAQARATRRSVVTAAAGLFVERGYAATTIDAVATRAGVSRKTVFSAVEGGKPTLLKLAWDWAVVGDDEPVPMADRPEVERMRRADDPVVVVGLQAHQSATVSARLAAIARVVAAAADVDAEVARLKRTTDEQRLTGATLFVRSLADRGWLRPGLTERWAAQTVWVLIDSAVYGRLVDEQGWTVREYESWLADTLASVLLTVRTP